MYVIKLTAAGKSRPEYAATHARALDKLRSTYPTLVFSNGRLDGKAAMRVWATEMDRQGDAEPVAVIIPDPLPDPWPASR